LVALDRAERGEDAARVEAEARGHAGGAVADRGARRHPDHAAGGEGAPVGGLVREEARARAAFERDEVGHRSGARVAPQPGLRDEDAPAPRLEAAEEHAARAGEV